MLKKWKIIRSELIHDHTWYKVRQDLVELPDGRLVDDYFVYVKPDIAIILAVTPENEAVLVRQYKHGAREILLELPAGIVDKNEDPHRAALRELREETGYVASAATQIAILHDGPTKDTGLLYVFVAENVRLAEKQDLDANECIEVETASLHALEEKVYRGEITVSGTIAAILLGLRYLAAKRME